jgi:hypothetical protein
LWKHHVNLILQIYYLLLLHILRTDKDSGLRIESLAVINLRGVSTNKTIICFIAMQTYKLRTYLKNYFCLAKKLNFRSLQLKLCSVSAVRRSAGVLPECRSSAGAPAVFYQPEPELLCFLPSSGWKIRMTYITSVILLQENMQYYRTYSRHSLL